MVENEVITVWKGQSDKTPRRGWTLTAQMLSLKKNNNITNITFNKININTTVIKIHNQLK